MADQLAVYAVSSLIHTGSGQLTGFLVTTSAASSIVTFYDNTAGSGTKICEVISSVGHPANVFFSERFFPRFSIGLYVVLPANTTVTVWSRQL